MICLPEFILNVVIFGFITKFFELILECSTLFEKQYILPLISMNMK